MRFLTLAAVLFSLVPAASGQEIKADVLEKLKSATVYIIVDNGIVRSTGTGFLFLKRGTTGYLMTCEHVVGRSSTVKVVFWSGTKQEKTVDARVVATDPSRDIACLIVRDFQGLPAVLDLGQKTVVRETETVFAAGFPFGAMLAAGQKHPEISISKSSVMSIRRNDAGDVMFVQISGEVNPGNSGGPFVGADGRVIGVTSFKVSGTQTAFAVASEEIQGFLKGRVKASTFIKREGTDAKAKYEVVLDLVDPLATLKGAGIAYIDADEVKGEPAPEKDGTWKKAHPSMKSVSFKIDEDRAVSTLEFTRPAGGPGRQFIIFQCYYIRANGQTIWTEPVEQPIVFGAGSGDPSGGRRDPGRKPKDPPGTSSEPEPPPGPEPPAVAASEMPIPDSVSFAAELSVRSVFGGLAMAPDGSILYALDLSEGKVYKLDPDTLEIKASAAIFENAVAMTLTPDGKTLYVGGRSNTRQDQSQELPALQVIKTAGFTVAQTLRLKGPIVDLVATDNGMVVATTLGQWGGLIVVEVATGSETAVHQVYGGGTIRLSRDQRRAYIGDRGLSPADYRCVPLRRENGAYSSYDSVYHGEHQLGGHFELSPDGRYLIGGYGSVLRLGKTKSGDLQFMAKIDAFGAAAVGEGSSTLFTFSQDGFMKAYTLGTFELQKSVRLGFKCERGFIDARRKRVYGVFGAVSENRFPDRNSQIGRVAYIKLGDK